MKNNKIGKSKKLTLVTGPNTALNNKTGPWRTQKPATDYDICISCAMCSKVCPENCIEMKANKNYSGKLKPVTDYNYCKGCALCAKECPVKAIKMINDF